MYRVYIKSTHWEAEPHLSERKVYESEFSFPTFTKLYRFLSQARKQAKKDAFQIECVTWLK